MQTPTYDNNVLKAHELLQGFRDDNPGYYNFFLACLTDPELFNSVLMSAESGGIDAVDKLKESWKQ